MTGPGGLTPQQEDTDYSYAALADRHDRQHSLLAATGELPDRPCRVLDMGSGTGVTAVWAARQGWQVTAADISEANLSTLADHLAVAEPELASRIDIVIADAVDGAGIADGVYDVVYLKSLLEHVEDYQRCLTTAAAKLRPGGLLYVSTTNVVCPVQLEYHGVGPYSWYPRWLKDRIRRYAMAKRPQIVRHTSLPALHWFTRRSLGNALQAAGFTRIWDVYDLIRAPRDLTRRTRLIYPLARYARHVPLGKHLVDVVMPEVLLVAQK